MLTIPEVGRVLRIRDKRAYVLAREAKLPGLRVGTPLRVPVKALESWIAAGGDAAKSDGGTRG